MESHRILQTAERAIVHEERLQPDVAKRRGAKRVPIGGVASHLLEAEVLVGARAIERDVADRRRDLRNPRYVLAEIAEHLVRAARNGMTRDAIRRAEKEGSAPLLYRRERVPIAARVAIDWRVGVDL